MKLIAPLAVLALVATPLAAQTTTSSKVSTDTDMKNGVATRTTKVEHVSKRKTNRPKKVLGVKVGHKTVTHKTTRTTKTSSNGDASTTTETN